MIWFLMFDCVTKCAVCLRASLYVFAPVNAWTILSPNSLYEAFLWWRYYTVNCKSRWNVGRLWLNRNGGGMLDWFFNIKHPIESICQNYHPICPFLFIIRRLSLKFPKRRTQPQILSTIETFGNFRPKCSSRLYALFLFCEEFASRNLDSALN